MFSLFDAVVLHTYSYSHIMFQKKLSRLKLIDICLLYETVTIIL